MEIRADGPEFAVAGLTAKLGNTPALAVLAYCLSSISMTVVNKFCLSGAHWNLNFFYLAFQCLVCVCAVVTCRLMGWADLSGFDRERAQKWFPVSLGLVGMIYTSTKALQFLSVPVYTIFKNLTIIVIAYGEALWFGSRVTSMALASFGLILLSSIVAAWADIQLAIHHPHLTNPQKSSAAQLSTLHAGFAWMSLNVFCSSSFILGMRRVVKKMQFTDWDTIFYNNLLMLPILLAFSLVLEDWSTQNISLNFPPERRKAQLLAMLWSGLATVYISYTSAWCIRITTSTTYSMVGALNKLPIALTGLVFFRTPATLGSVSAIFLGFVSGLVYAWAKIRQSDAARRLKLPMHEPKLAVSDVQEKAG